MTSWDLPIGIGDRVQVIRHGGVSALVEPEVCIESLENDDERLIKAVLSHDRVICELFRQTTVLPLRFGTTFVSTERLLTHLEAQSQNYLNTLHQLQGKAEYSLNFIPRTLEEPSLSPKVGGRQYFLAKKQRYKAQQDFQVTQETEWDNVVKIITQVYPSAIIAEPQEEKRRIYLLVNSANSPLLTEQFLAWQKACPRWKLQLGEALPPYHFI
jgi:hypothetical protein